mmetsp:Transcript_1915/g.5273  ORF Transcript_1915/g.5273 Transcript_1915/m.5273 type:complete len:145 (+) Transcript_1915:58-492(+)
MKLLGIAVIGKGNQPLYLIDCTKIAPPSDETDKADATTTDNDKNNNNNNNNQPKKAATTVTTLESPSPIANYGGPYCTKMDASCPFYGPVERCYSRRACGCIRRCCAIHFWSVTVALPTMLRLLLLLLLLASCDRIRLGFMIRG